MVDDYCDFESQIQTTLFKEEGCVEALDHLSVFNTVISEPVYILLYKELGLACRFRSQVGHCWCTLKQGT